MADFSGQGINSGFKNTPPSLTMNVRLGNENLKLNMSKDAELSRDVPVFVLQSDGRTVHLKKRNIDTVS